MRGKAGFFAGLPFGTTLLLHFDGDDQDETTTDSSPFGRAVTLTEGAVISTTQSKFGGSSLYADGVGYAEADLASDRGFATNDFTIEGWFYVPYSMGDVRLVSGYTDAVCHWMLYSVSGEVFFLMSRYPETWEGDASIEDDIPRNQWFHLAVVRQSGVIVLYINGTAATQFSSNNQGLDLPSVDTVGIGTSLENGIVRISSELYADEVRIVHEAVFTENFTPPTAPYT